MAANSTKAIYFALGANAGIAVTKFGAAAYTGSGAMLAEAIHSVADTANQLLLLLGLKRAGIAASEEHPLGYHRVTYFYGMMVALLLFFVGGLFSIYEGWHRLASPEPLRNADWAVVDYLTFMGEPTPARTIHPQDDPRRANPEHGRTIIAQAVDQIVKQVQEFL